MSAVRLVVTDATIMRLRKPDAVLALVEDGSVLTALLDEIERLRAVIATNAAIERSSIGVEARARVDALNDAANALDYEALHRPEPTDQRMREAASIVRSLIGAE